MTDNVTIPSPKPTSQESEEEPVSGDTDAVDIGYAPEGMRSLEAWSWLRRMAREGVSEAVVIAGELRWAREKANAYIEDQRSDALRRMTGGSE